MKTKDLCLGVILILAILVIGFFVHRCWKTFVAKDRFTLATPATPRIREGVNGLFTSLTDMVALGQSFESEASNLSEVFGKVPPQVSAARKGVSELTKRLNKITVDLGTTPPTYANYLAIYRGLESTDDTLLAAADSYTALGRQVHQGMALNPPGTPDADVANAGALFMAMGRQLRRVVMNVHRLGVALDLE